MWILALGLAVLELARAVRAGRKPFDQLELDVMYLFGRIWHAVTWNRPAPVPERGPAIVIANHGSLADPCFLIAGCPRKIHFLQAKECYEVPLLRHLFRLGGCIPVARNGKDVAAVRLALERLAHGAVLGVFPEGNLDRDDLTQLGEAHLGVAFLALHSRAPVVPAYISGGPGNTRSAGSLAPSNAPRACDLWRPRGPVRVPWPPDQSCALEGSHEPADGARGQVASTSRKASRAKGCLVLFGRGQ